MIQPIKIIRRHQGDVSNWEYGYYVLYTPVSNSEYVKIEHCAPEHPDFCVCCGGFGECECTSKPEFLEDKITAEKIVALADNLGFPMAESDGELVIDTTWHEPEIRKGEEELGCVVCYPKREEKEKNKGEHRKE